MICFLKNVAQKRICNKKCFWGVRDEHARVYILTYVTNPFFVQFVHGPFLVQRKINCVDVNGGLGPVPSGHKPKKNNCDYNKLPPNLDSPD